MNIWKSIDSFNAGELSPLLLQKTSLDKYHIGMETCENAIPYLHGPIESRIGTQYVNEVRNSAHNTYVITFKFNDSEEYTIEAGHYYFRFYKNGARLGVPYELYTVYEHTHIPTLVFSRTGDVMYIFSPYYPVYKLSRLGDTEWVLTRVSFLPPPSYVKPTYLSATLTPAATSGTGINLTASAGVFRQVDVGRLLFSGSARASITEYTSTTVVKADILDSFPNTDVIADGDWYLSGSPAATITPEDFSPPGKIVVLLLTSAIRDPAAVTAAVTGVTVTITYNSHGYSDGQYVLISGASSAALNGVWVISSVTENTFQYAVPSDPKVSGGGTGIKCARSLSGWRTADIGKYVILNNGVFRITSIVTGAAAKAEIMKSPVDTTSVPLGLWSLESSSFDLLDEEASKSVSGITRSGNIATVTTSGNHGYAVGDYVNIKGADQIEYNNIHRIHTDATITATTFEIRVLNLPTTPATGTITVARGQRNFPTETTSFQGAMWIGSTTAQPFTFWRSVLGEDYENYAKGNEDTASIDRTLDTYNRITWMMPAGNTLAIGTDGEEYSVGATREGEAITPVNIRVIKQTTHGSLTDTQPLNINNTVMFVQKAGNKLMEYEYYFDSNKYVAEDKTILSEHITLSGIKKIGYIKEPRPLVLILRNDGVLVVCLYLKSELANIACFSRLVTDGLIKDFCTTRNNNIEQVWLIVERTINSQTKKYVEVMNESLFNGVEGWKWASVQSDCAIKVATNGLQVISGLGHLENKEVSVTVDGILQTNKVVTDGKITLDKAGSVTGYAEIGIPFKKTIKTTRPKIEFPDGTSQGRVKGWSELSINLLNSQGGTLNKEPLPSGYFSGDHNVYDVGYDVAGQLLVESNISAPLKVLSISGKLDVN